MKRKRITQASIAKKTGKTPMAVHDVMIGRLYNQAIRDEIANAIGVDVKEIWPDPIPKRKSSQSQSPQIGVEQKEAA